MSTDAKPKERAEIWVTFRDSPLAVKTVLGGVFVNRVGGFLNIFIVLYMISEGYSIQQATFALGSYGGGAVIGVLVGGALADRLGARNATVISMGSTAVLTASLLYLPNYPSLLVAVVLVGLVSQIYRPASATLMSELTPEDRQIMIFAMYRFGLNVGAMAAPLIGFALYYLNGEQYTLLFWGEALIALVYAALAQLTLPARTRTVADATAGADTAPSGSYLDVLRDRRFSLYLISVFLFSTVYVQYLSTLPLDVQASGLPIFWYTFAVSFNGLMVIAIELPVTKVSQNWPFRVTIGGSMVLLGLGMAAYGLPLGPGVIILGTMIWTTAEILGAPAAFAYPAVAGPAHLKGRYIGSFQFMFGLGSAAGPVVGGVLFAKFGHSVWPMLAIGAAFAFVLVLLSVNNQPATAVGAGKADPGTVEAGTVEAGTVDSGKAEAGKAEAAPGQA